MTATTGTGASGEMRETVPQIHSSIIRSPTTRIVRPRMRSNERARVARRAASRSRDVVLEDQALLDEIADDVRHHLMHFLHDRGVAVGPDQREIGEIA